MANKNYNIIELLNHLIYGKNIITLCYTKNITALYNRYLIIFCVSLQNIILT